MCVIRNHPAIGLYTCQFGQLFHNGSAYMAQILRRYREQNITLDTSGIKQLILYVAKENEIRPSSVRNSIKRYLDNGWKQNINAWKEYTDWNQDSPPDVNTAIKLLCKSYAVFEESYKVECQRTREVIKQTFGMIQEDGAEFPPASEHGSLMEEIIASNLFMPLDDDDLIDAYACYLAYRTQRDFYELCQERGQLTGLSWERFVSAMLRCKRARDVAEIVLQETIKKISTTDHFNFDAENKLLYRDVDLADINENDILTYANLLNADKRYGLVLLVLLKVEIAQYCRQLNQGKDYSWEQYLLDVLQNRILWDEIILAFRDVLRRLDFKSVWQSENLEELISQIEEFQEIEDRS